MSKEQKTPTLITPQEAADMLGLKPTTLMVWRSRFPDRLPYVKVGPGNSRVMYDLDDVLDFIERGRRGRKG